MADEPEAERLDVHGEEEGGPIKSFLEHLEDLRWVLIKSIAAAGIAMLICLLAGNHVVAILERPLKRAPALHVKKSQIVIVVLGTNRLAAYHFPRDTNNPLLSLTGTNSFVRLHLEPLSIGTNQLLSVRPEAEPEDSPEALRERLPIEIVNFSPAGPFVVATKVAFYGGLVLAAPFIFYFVSSFVFPALKMREKKYVYRGLFFGAGLFMSGVAFCYFALMPVALAASAQYAEWMGFTTNQWRAEDYIGFVCKFMLGMGLGFELPVVLLTLVKIGVLNYRVLKAGRPYAIVISFVLGAILTTPEVITQVLMAIPLLLLYEISVQIAGYWERGEKKREQAAEAELK